MIRSNDKKGALLLVIFCLLCLVSTAQNGSKNQIWSPDQGDGTYINPIIHADYSDPDICRVGGDFYMTASSFNAMPGLPILHSRDLVNWTLINHALPMGEDTFYDQAQHGNGVWAPSIRHHEGKFYIYWGDPDRGIFMVQTDDPADRWSAPVLVKKAYGNIDACPLWDEDGKMYLVHAFAHSRAGVKSILQVVELSADGASILDKGTIVFDGHADHPTIEGPKFYKRNGYYYIFAPGGGVPTGWQVILRSKSIYGPYEDKIVLAQGNSAVNGPHQGGWVELDNGESWFVHFQDKGAYGRIVHLQPVKWVNDWPVMGSDPDGDGTGEPVLRYAKPNLPKQVIQVPKTSDEFESPQLGLQWQWNANISPSVYSLEASSLTLYAQPYVAGSNNLWLSPSVLTQKLPADQFSMTALLDISGLKTGEEAGLVVFGMDYATIQVKRTESALIIEQQICMGADHNQKPLVIEHATTSADQLYLKIKVNNQAKALFFFSEDGKKYSELGGEFTLREGKWVGTKIGIFAHRSLSNGIPGSANWDWVRFEQ